MKMTTRIAYANVKYHKSKNVLTGIAIFLTTLLLFLVPTIGFNLIDGELAVVNELYPDWHAIYRDISEEQVTRLSAHHAIERYGLKSDVGYIISDDAEIPLYFLDENGFDLYNMELVSGYLPEKETEIVVSKGMLEALNEKGEIGDTICISYQVSHNGTLDYKKEKEFVISGFIADTESESDSEEQSYSAFVSQVFLENEIPAEEILYDFLLRISDCKGSTTDVIEGQIENILEQFEIKENAVGINTEYLWANYTDTSYITGIAGIILVIVMAGVITIYSIYYVSMGDRIREFGKLKAIGATKQQIRKIVLGEGMIVALVTIPIGLLAGTILSRIIFLNMLTVYCDNIDIRETWIKLLENGEIPLYHIWIYLLTILVALLTVFLSLCKPMKIAEKVSEIEAMRYQDRNETGKKYRKGYANLSVYKLAKVYLLGNKKKTAITIFSMGITGMFLMVVATILSCTNPVESANNSVLGQYEITPIVEFGNKEHPEREWHNIQKNNPLTEELKLQIEEIEGVNNVECFSEIYITSEVFHGDREGIIGVSAAYKEELENGIIEGKAFYEDLLDGNKVIVDKNLLYWYPDIKVGDVLEVQVVGEDYKRKLEVAAIGEYPLSVTNYNYLIMAKEGVETFSDNNLNYYYHVFAEKKYDEMVEKQLEEVIREYEVLELYSWQDSYEEYKSNISMASGMCYAFLGILGIICIMNMINTMIHSVHIRKKEIGILQAIGMSDVQLMHMLQMEGLFYTIGTVLFAVGGGSAISYPVFLWAKDNGIFNISHFYYPTTAAVIISTVLIVVQLLLSIMLSKSVKKESLIERIRFSE